jgi:hypothetical protein
MSFLGIQRTRKTLTENYDIILWMFCVFLGGSLNVGFINALNNYSQYWVTNVNKSPLSQTSAELALSGLLIVVIILPIILSLILTSIQPSHLIVPPFFITIVSAVWAGILLVNAANIGSMLATVVTLGLFYSALGYMEDSLTTKILGKTAERESVYFEHFRVYSDVDSVKTRLLIPEIRRGLHISERTGDDGEGGLIFKSIATTFKSDLTVTKDKDYPELTSLKVVYYEIGNYSLKVSPFFIEQMHKMSGYIKDVFNNHLPIMGVEVISSFTNKVNDPTVDKVINNFQGFYHMSKQLSITDRFKIALFVGILVLTGILFLIEQPGYAVLSIAIEVLIAVLGLPDLIRKRTG